jgi:hypothetical protein
MFSQFFFVAVEHLYTDSRHIYSDIFSGMHKSAVDPLQYTFEPCLGSGCYSQACHLNVVGSVLGHSMGDLWWTK